MQSIKAARRRFGLRELNLDLLFLYLSLPPVRPSVRLSVFVPVHNCVSSVLRWRLGLGDAAKRAVVEGTPRHTPRESLTRLRRQTADTDGHHCGHSDRPRG